MERSFFIPPYKSPEKSIKILFCLPGDNFSKKFLECWNETVVYCLRKGIEWNVSLQYSSNVYAVRNFCLGGNPLLGNDQKPYDGKIDYDYLMWIDSDTVWKPEQIITLINHNKDIVSGVCAMQNGKGFAVVKETDEAYFMKHGNYQFLTPEDAKKHKGLIEVFYTGFGFILIKKGVFEKFEYPWFRGKMHKAGKTEVMASEDASFCIIAQEKGFKVYVDPSVRVGHEKKIVL